MVLRDVHVSVRCEEVSATKDEVTLLLRATKLDKKDLFGKSDPFLLLHRVNEDGRYVLCFCIIICDWLYLKGASVNAGIQSYED